MKPGDRDRDRALDDLAASWLCERAEGFTPERAREFHEWRERDVRHAAAVDRVERALALLDDMPAIRAPLEARFGPAAELETAAPPARPAAPRFPSAVRWLAMAAAFAVAALGWWRSSSQSPLPPQPSGEHYATDDRVQRRVALSDGSVVDMNRASAVQVEYQPDTRRVHLSTGEAHFQVAADAARPFVVRAGNVSVRAVGTAFNVRVNPGGEVEVIVLEGTVEVSRAEAKARLVAGERTQLAGRDAGAPHVVKATPETMRAAVAWQNPLATFNNVPLRDVIARMNQRNTLQLVLAAPELGERKIGGVIALDQVEAFVRLLEQDGDLVAEHGSPGEIKLTRAP